MDPRAAESAATLAAIDDAAAAWVARHDRGLTAAEQDEFGQWLAADPRHGERFARHRRGWNQLARLALWRPGHADEPNPDVLAPPRPPPSGLSWRWIAPAALAAAALALVAFLPRGHPPESARAVAEASYRQEVLDDGTLVEFNRGAEVRVAFTPAERRVQLAHGEALFTVARNPARPFVVEAGGVTVRAIGTAFSVRLGPAGVDVLVTEGRVQVERAAAPLPIAPPVAAGHRVVVPFAGEAPAAIAAVTPEEIDQALLWQPRLLEFVSTPLAEVAAEFNRRNRLQLVVADEALRALPIGASFRSDNVDGFVRLLEASFGVAAVRREGVITLRRAAR
jgi:transmembrane sensor